MVARFFHCDPKRLKLFLDDQLSRRQQTALDKHLESCNACQQKLELVAADPRWWNEAQEFLRTPSPLSTRRPGDDPSGGGSQGAAAPTDEGLLLDFLGPSDDPEMLGRLGPYEISEVIGCGGMGVVLKAFDPGLNRYVAIKVLAPQLAVSGAGRRRFAREARAAAAVNHEHVMTIHAVDSAGGLPYLVMPLIAGESLQERIDHSGPLEVREILRIGMQTAAGLAAAHAQGLVHRDIKPANILLEKGLERVLITDFGLARAVDDASLTRSGVVAGTPQFMAPEQANSQRVDHRADLFSLGSVLYTGCAGRAPFRAETTMAVLRRICEHTARPIREINPDIPEWLAEIVEKLHQKDPADRFQSASEVAELLGRHLAHLEQPLSVPMPGRLKVRSTATPAGRRSGTRKLIAAAILLCVAGLAAAGIIGITRPADFGTTDSPAQPPRQTALPPDPRQEQLPQAAPIATALRPPVTVVTPEFLNWDDKLQERIGQIREEMHGVVGSSDERPGGDQSPDSLWELDERVEDLRQELNGGWP